MAQEKDLSEAESLDFSFNIEDTHDLEGNDLDSFLNEEEAIIGGTKGITPSGNHNDNNDEVIIPGAPKPNKPKADPAKPTPKPKEQVDADKNRNDEEEDFNKYLEDDDSAANKDKPSKKPSDSPDEEHQDNNDEGDDGIRSFAEDLYKIGFFTKRDENEEVPATDEDLLAKLQDEKQLGAEELVDELAGRHGEEYREAFYAMFVNGVHPKEYISKFLEVQSFKELDMTDEANQVRVVETGLRKQNWDEEDIKAEVQRLKTNSDLDAVSGRYHKALVKSEEAGLAKLEETAKANTERLQVLDKQYYTSLNNILGKAIKDKEINGIPVTKELAQKAFDLAYVKKWTLPKSKEEITDLERIFLESKKPENHEFRTQLSVLLAQTFEGWEAGKKLSLDLSKVQKKAVSSDSSELFHSLVRNKKQNGATNRASQPTKEKYDF